MKYPPWRFQERSLNGKGEVSMFAWIVWHFITTRHLPTINTSHLKKMPGCGRRLFFGGEWLVLQVGTASFRKFVTEKKHLMKLAHDDYHDFTTSNI